MQHVCVASVPLFATIQWIFSNVYGFPSPIPIDLRWVLHLLAAQTVVGRTLLNGKKEANKPSEEGICGRDSKIDLVRTTLRNSLTDCCGGATATC